MFYEMLYSSNERIYQETLVLRKSLDHYKRLGILPGSRLPEAGENLCLILRVVEYISNLKCDNTEISFYVALVSALDDYLLENVITTNGWRLCYPTNKE